MAAKSLPMRVVTRREAVATTAAIARSALRQSQATRCRRATILRAQNQAVETK